MEQLLDATPLFLTGNTDTVYASTFYGARERRTVVEVPPGCGPGTVNDAYFRFVVDRGAPGPDKGKGGKYLILPADYKGDVPTGYRSASYMNWLILRGFWSMEKPDAAPKQFSDGLKVYPLAMAKNPPAMQFIDGSAMVYNTIHANNYVFYEEIAAVIAGEQVDFLDPELCGLLASIGIRKDKPFAPDARMKVILTAAVTVGNATARDRIPNP